MRFTCRSHADSPTSKAVKIAILGAESTGKTTLAQALVAALDGCRGRADWVPETLREWGHRFAAQRDRARELYDERFCRMWEFYLAASECAFRFGGMNNFQIQFVKNQNVLPLTRNYITEEEERMRVIDSELPRLKSVSVD